MDRRSSKASASKVRKAAPARNADATRARILKAAKERFSRVSYDGVGVREIAADAAVDPALVMRYFGSKEGLFREIAMHAFDTEGLLDGDVADLPENAARHLTSEVGDDAWRTGYDPFRLLLCSISSESAGPLLAEHFVAGFVEPLARSLEGKHSRERAIMLASQIVGFALVRFALSSEGGSEPRMRVLQTLLSDSLRASVDGASRV